MKLHQKISLILFGLFLTIVILEIGLRIGGFAILSIQEYRNLQSIKQKGSLRIMCLGESTTQGQYPPYLEEILNQRNIGIKFSVIDKGIVGTRTEAILWQLESNLDKYQPDIVVTMMGINDDEGRMSYETASTSKIVLTLCSFRVYKLTRLIWLHMTTKCKEVSKKQDFIQQGQAFMKAIELNPNSDSAYIELGWFYKYQEKFTESEQAFKKALELNPNSDSAYVGLGWLYQRQGKHAESERVFKKAIELSPNSDSVYANLGRFYRVQGKLAESELAFKKALELNPKNVFAYKELGWLYRVQGKLAESEQAFKKALELNSNSERLYRCLATIYREIGNNELYETYDRKADSIINNYYNSVTVNNYRILKQILDKRKIKLVCAQYPVRNIELLKRIFKEETEGSIIFVDNEKIFKDAIIKEGYKEYFRDMFGGNFGHCTEKGNRLLAENIANAILKEVFNKK